MNILVVDDNADSRLFLKLTLTAAGHEVQQASQGEEALAMARKMPPECIVSDIFMPVMDGFKLCFEVKHDPVLKRIPFIFYSATYVDREDEDLAMGLGASRFIVKPVDNNRFLDILNQVLQEAKLPVSEGLVQEPGTLFRQYDAALARKLEQKITILNVYEKIFENSPDAIACLNQDGLIIRQNKSHRDLLGFTNEELFNLGPACYLDTTAMKSLARVMENGISGKADVIATSKNGRKIHVTYSIFPVQDTAHKFAAYILMLKDMTENYKYARRLEEERNRMEIITNSVGAGICEISTNYKVIWANKVLTDIFGPVETKSCFQVFNQQEDICPNCGVKKVFENKIRRAAHEQTGLDAAGNRVWSQIIATPVYNQKGEVTRAIEVVIDITGQKKLEAQLHQAQKMDAIGQLAGGVAHDYNNMLGVIMGYAELALDRVDSNDSLHEDLQEILTAAKRSADITKQLLIFARKQTISPKILSLNEVVESMLKMLRRLIGENIDLDWVPASTLWPVKIDPVQIDQVLANLCVNARDAIAENGKIIIKTENITIDKAYCVNQIDAYTGDYILLTVSDDGCGMEKDIVSNIFEPFFTTKKEGQGTGLGLSTVFGIVKQNKGFINVYSEAGKGTTFKIYIPRHIGLVSKERKDTVIESPISRGETVLVVEDENAILKLIQKTLNNLGYNVFIADTPKTAIRIAESNTGTIDLLITDVIMPDMNGRELTKQITNVCPRIKVLFMSGYNSDVITHQGILDKGVNFIQKPFSTIDLAIKLRAILDK